MVGLVGFRRAGFVPRNFIKFCVKFYAEIRRETRAGLAFEISLAKFRAKTGREILNRAVRELVSSLAARFKIS